MLRVFADNGTHASAKGNGWLKELDESVLWHVQTRQQSQGPDFTTMKLLVLSTFLCIVLMTATTSAKRADNNCNSRQFDLTMDNRNKINANRALWPGGTDEEGVERPGASSYKQLKGFTTCE
ncbi:MAG: hypothetical protein Q9184_000682 [Pyrenodesmia sp. 2 TL-2023]